jgi:hypothetical protein
MNSQLTSIDRLMTALSCLRLSAVASDASQPTKACHELQPQTLPVNDGAEQEEKSKHSLGLMRRSIHGKRIYL